MKIFYPFILLPLLLLHVKSMASTELANDSIGNNRSDSLPKHVPIEKFSYSLNLGNPFVYDRLISAFQSDSVCVPIAGSFRFGMNPYTHLLNRTAVIPDLDSNSGVSDINLVLGSTREQLLFLEHHQKVSKHMTGFLNYNSIVSPGFLLNCLSKFRKFELGLSYNRSLFNSYLNFNFGKVEADENGGVKPDQVTGGLSKSEFEQLQTFLNDDKRVVRQYDLTWRNDVSLFNSSKTDSLHNFKLALLTSATWYKWSTSYSGTADTSFYVQILKDSTLTYDTAGFSYYSGSPALDFTWVNPSFSASLKTGITLVFLKNRIDTVKMDQDYLSPFVSLILSSGKFRLNSEFNSVSAGNKMMDGDFSLRSDLQFNMGTRLLKNVRLELGFTQAAPEYTSVFYSSNHFSWENDFLKEDFKWFKFSVAAFNSSLITFVEAYRESNRVYFNETAKPVQSDQTLDLFNTGVRYDLSSKHWRLLGCLKYTLSSENFIRVPEWGAYLRLSYLNRYFKKALLAEFGTALSALDRWNAYAFMPATGLQYLQHDLKAGGAPSLDVFVNADMGRATLSLMMQRINDRWFGGENYVAAAYPAPPRTLKFSLRWRLYN